jgi:hypothetical protein
MSKKRPGVLQQFFQGFNEGAAQGLKGVVDLGYILAGEDVPPEVKVSRKKVKPEKQEKRVRVQEPIKEKEPPRTQLKTNAEPQKSQVQKPQVLPVKSQGKTPAFTPYIALTGDNNGIEEIIEPDQPKPRTPITKPVQKDAFTPYIALTGDNNGIEEIIEPDQPKPRTPITKPVQKDLTLKQLDDILNNINFDLSAFSDYIPSEGTVEDDDKRRKISSVRGKDNTNFILKEMKNELKDVSPLISKYIATTGKKYPERLLKYYGNLDKNLSKKLSGDFSACLLRDKDPKYCRGNGKELEIPYGRISFLAKNYKELIQSLNELHDLGLAHFDIKYDNLFHEKDKIYMADYDKSCRTKPLSSSNEKINQQLQEIDDCETKIRNKKDFPIEYVPFQIYIDQQYKDYYDFYELAITFYEIILGMKYMNKEEDKLIEKMGNKEELRVLFEERYTDLKKRVLQWFKNVKTDEERNLLKFIIQFANPFRIPCDRNSKDPNPDCYETMDKKTGDERIIPSYCDRILYNYSRSDMSAIQEIKSKGYGSFYFEDPSHDSDHNAVYAQLEIQIKKRTEEKLSGGNILTVELTGLIDKLAITYITLNQGSGLGDGEGANLLRFQQLSENQDIIAIGLQEIQDKSPISPKSPLINRLKNQLSKFELIHSDIYGLPTRRVGLFIFVKTRKDTKVSNAFEQCLVSSKIPLLCNKSMVGVTLSVNIGSNLELPINFYSAHLSFSRKEKDLGLKLRKEQLMKVIKKISEISKYQGQNYINILGGDLNFRKSDFPTIQSDEEVITKFIDENKKNIKIEFESFKEPIDQLYSFPPTCKYKTNSKKKKLRSNPL